MDRTSLYIVEDEAIVAQDLHESLVSLGYSVSGIAKSGEKAIEMIPSLLPDLVLMDIHLAGSIDGIQAADKIHQDLGIPVIFLTAYTDRDLLDRAKKTLPYGYIIKPYNELALQSAIEMAVYKSHTEARIAESERKYRTLFENMTNGFCFMKVLYNDQGEPFDCEYLDANPVFLQLMHIGDAQGKRLLDPANSGVMVWQHLYTVYTRVAQSGVTETMEIECPGQSLWLRVLVSCPIRNHVLAVFENVTESRLATEALRRANYKLNLMASITRHDICNQLHALQSYFELIRQSPGDEAKMREYVSNGARAAHAIERQIAFTREYQDLGVKDAIWHTLDTSIRHAMESLPMDGIRVRTVDSGVDIYADPLFEKVFYNLIDNALRYGGPDLSIITIAARKSGDKSLAITVEDNGEGIAENDRPHLFERGFGKHTGLGLFLSREILAITGIGIRETGKPGSRGALFEITVPDGAWRDHHGEVSYGFPEPLAGTGHQ